MSCSLIRTIRAIWRRRIRVHYRSVVSKEALGSVPRRVIALIEFLRDGFDPLFPTMPEGKIR